MTADRPIRFGLVGGRWGVNYLRTVASRPEWEIPVVARARTLPLPPPFADVLVTTDWRSLAQIEPALDAVILVTPPATHIEMAGYFVEHGIPVLIEKPLCLDPASARRLQAQARERRALVWVDHTHLFHPAYRALKQQVAGQSIIAMHARAGNVGPFRADTPVYWDWLPHDVAMMLDLAGESPAAVSAQAIECKTTEQGTGETWECSLAFPSRATGHARVTNLHLPKCRLLAVRTGQAVHRYDGLSPHPLVALPAATLDEDLWAAPGRPVDVPVIQPLDQLLIEFSAAIRAGDYANPSLELGCRVVETLAKGLNDPAFTPQPS